MATLSLPGRPSLDHLRAQARALQRAVRAGDPDAVARVARHHPDSATDNLALSAAQLVIAREYGFTSWPRLKHHVELVAEHAWLPDAPGGADEFGRLACLTYADDRPARWARARELLAADPGLVDDDIWAAATASDPAAVRRLLAADPSLASRRGGPCSWRPLFHLAYSRLDEDVAADDVLTVARLLLDAGADPHEGYLWNGEPYPFTLLTGAFGEGELGPARQPRHPHSLALARLLLDAGADPNDSQALYNRMFRPGDDHLELLFEYGLGTGDGGRWKARLGDEIDTPAELLRTQLRWAVEHDLADRVRRLLAHGVDIATAYDDGRTAAELAVRAGSSAIAEQLRAAGSPAARSGPVDQLVGAALRADAATVERLWATHPTVVDDARAARPGLIVWAAATGRADAVALLARLGFDVNARGRGDAPVEEPWETALHQAAVAGDRELAELLVALGADPGIRDVRFDATPPDWARHAGHDAVAELLDGNTTGA